MNKAGNLVKYGSGFVLAGALGFLVSQLPIFDRSNEQEKESQTAQAQTGLEEKTANASTNIVVDPIARAIEGFPKQIPGIVRIDKEYFPGSSGLLVHIRQTYTDNGTNSVCRKEDIAEVQDEVFKAIGFLRTNLNLNAIYSGGISESELVRLKEDKGAVLVYKSIKPRPFKDDKERNVITKLLNSVTNKVDAAQRAFVEYPGLDLRTAESSVLNGKAFLADLNYKMQSQELIDSLRNSKDVSQRTNIASKIVAIIEDRNKKVISDREEYVLRMVARDFEFGAPEPSTNRVATVVFGSAHKFRKSIAEWNIKHPQNGFSYVALTPYAQAKIDGRKLDEKVKKLTDQLYESKSHRNNNK